MDHKYIGDEYTGVTCLVCGGLWDCAGNGKAPGAVATALNGDLASTCSGKTNECHHLPGECSLDECWRTGQCNCLQCDF